MFERLARIALAREALLARDWASDRYETLFEPAWERVALFERRVSGVATK